MISVGSVVQIYSGPPAREAEAGLARHPGPRSGYCVVADSRMVRRPFDLPVRAFRITLRRDAFDRGELAQLGERLVCNQEVTGSSPVFSTNLR